MGQAGPGGGAGRTVGPAHGVRAAARGLRLALQEKARTDPFDADASLPCSPRCGPPRRPGSGGFAPRRRSGPPETPRPACWPFEQAGPPPVDT